MSTYTNIKAESAPLVMPAWNSRTGSQQPLASVLSAQTHAPITLVLARELCKAPGPHVAQEQSPCIPFAQQNTSTSQPGPRWM